MGGKKDPGKFTVRFNVADPQQRTAAELLNRQGRCKAQFITNAVLFYVHAAPEEHIPRYAGAAPSAGQQEASPAVEPRPGDDGGGLGDSELDSIRRTMEAFKAP